MPSAATPPAGPLAAEVAAILRGAAARRSLNQTALAEAAGVSQAQMSKLLRGAKPINVDQLDDLCRVLDLDVYAVLQEASAALGRGDHRATNVRPLVRARRPQQAVQRVDDGEDRAVAYDPGYLPDEDPDVID